MNYKQLIQNQAKMLKNITDIPIKEVEILILHIMKKDMIWLHLHYDDEALCEDELKPLVKLRSTSYPLEYITKTVSFYSRDFGICDGILIPRAETELLIDKTLEIIKNIKNPKIIEVGTGSGIISIMLAILVDDIDITAVDINDKALILAKKNSELFNVSHKIKFVKSDVFNDVIGDFDLCVSNPPYIKDDYILPKNVKFEPKNALFSGAEGMDILQRLILDCEAKNIGYLLCEMGYDQKDYVKNFVKNIKFEDINFYKDYENFDRGFVLKL